MVALWDASLKASGPTAHSPQRLWTSSGLANTRLNAWTRSLRSSTPLSTKLSLGTLKYCAAMRSRMRRGATCWKELKKSMVRRENTQTSVTRIALTCMLSDMSLIADLSRVIEQSTGRNEGKLDRWHYTKSSTIKITGRHVLPIWRLLKSDVNLLQYSFENVVFHILHIRWGSTSCLCPIRADRRQSLRTPHFSQQTLYSWMIDGVVSHLAHTFKYWLSRVEMDLALIEDAEVITNKT